jgi:hypothetical protein
MWEWRRNPAGRPRLSNGNRGQNAKTEQISQKMPRLTSDKSDRRQRTLNSRWRTINRQHTMPKSTPNIPPRPPSPAAHPSWSSKRLSIVVGQFAGDYNRRKHRGGAFGGERYQATMADSGEYLWNRLKYVELSMVRCGEVAHPGERDWSGRGDLMGWRKRNRLLDREKLGTWLKGYTFLIVAKTMVCGYHCGRSRESPGYGPIADG